MFANRGRTPDTWLGNVGTLGALAPNSESLLSPYDQPFGGMESRTTPPHTHTASFPQSPAGREVQEGATG